MYLYNGSTWSQAAGSFNSPSTVSCASVVFCIVGDGGNYLVYNGSGWSAPQPIDSNDPNVLLDWISCTASTFCMGIDAFDGRSYIYNGSGWSTPTPMPAGLDRVSCVSVSFCLATKTKIVGSGIVSIYSPSPEGPVTVRVVTLRVNAKHHTAKITFKAKGATGFLCALVRFPATRTHFAPCGSPKTYRHLKPGHYTFDVRALAVGGLAS